MNAEREGVEVVSRGRAERIVAAGAVIAFCYFGETVVLTILISILLTYLLDPVVVGLERLKLPRPMGALVSVLALLGILAGAFLFVGSRVEQIGSDWTGYYSMIERASTVAEREVAQILRDWAHVEPRETDQGLSVLLGGESGIRDFLIHQLDSLSFALSVAVFVPFLVFFMLSEKERLWRTGLKLFEGPHRRQASRALDELNEVLRGYLVGNLLVAGALVLTSFVFFWLLGLDYPFLSAVFSGLANLVPYLGAVLAWLPPFAIGLGQWRSVGIFLGIAFGLTLFHLLAINALFPTLVGRRVRVNATAITISLLFWGWLWGGIGLVVGIPIVAAAKVVCDHVDSWRPLGEWLGTDDDSVTEGT